MAMAGNGSIRAAFDQGQVPTIACFNRAKTPLGVDLDDLVGAMQVFVDDCFVPVWGTPAKLVRTADFVRNQWALVFLDDADQANALAYHELTPDGLPISKVFVRTTLEAGDLVSVSASHELAEMLVDPAINLLTTGPDPRAVYAYEAADPVEDLTFDVNGIPMTDFVYPSYFELFRKARSTKFDYLGKVDAPFQILAGGYQIVMTNGAWTQTFGSPGKGHAFGKEDRREHRSEIRLLAPERRATSGSVVGPAASRIVAHGAHAAA
jgi:hypothetical protein